MAGWLPLAISKDCGCDSKSLRDGWQMIGWLAPPSFKYFWCNRRSPRDGWEMAGWLALAFSNDFGRNIGSLGDVWQMDGRTHVVLKQQIQNKTIGTHTTTQLTLEINTITRLLGGWLWLFHKQIGCKSKSPGDGWERAGRLAIPKIAPVILDRCKVAGR